jgi:hypothetical protein
VSGVRHADPSPVRQLPLGCVQAVPRVAQGPVVLTVLSPRMVYSMTEWPRMQAVAQHAGFQVLAWHPASVPHSEWVAAARAAAWPEALTQAVRPVPPPCAAMLGAMNHHPHSLVLDARRFHGWPVWGVLSDSAWRDALAFRHMALTPESGAHLPAAMPGRPQGRPDLPRTEERVVP